jgi:glycosyltransferase involved in cell wall biosynthesis
MSVRNGAPLLLPAIDSILKQDFVAFEFLIVNDGSTDETPEILRRQTDPRIRVFHREPSGLPASLNFAIRQSRAPIIARQDADDLSEPARLSKLLSLLKKNPNASLVHSACHYDVQTGDAVRLQYMPKSRALIALSLCRRNIICHGSAMFPKDSFHLAGGYNELFAQSQDYDLWGRLLEQGEFLFCPQKLYRLRIHKQSVSSQKTEAQGAFARQIGWNNCQRWFHVSETEAKRIFNFLNHEPLSHDFTDWVRFVCCDLPRMQYQSPELYFWSTIQMVRAARMLMAP